MEKIRVRQEAFFYSLRKAHGKSMLTFLLLLTEGVQACHHQESTGYRFCSLVSCFIAEKAAWETV